MDEIEKRRLDEVLACVEAWLVLIVKYANDHEAHAPAIAVARSRIFEVIASLDGETQQGAAS